MNSYDYFDRNYKLNTLKLCEKTEKLLKRYTFDKLWDKMTNPPEPKSKENFTKTKQILIKNRNMEFFKPCNYL